MRTIFTFALVVIANCFVVAVDTQEIIKNNSPDGKFVLQLTHGEEGWDTAIIDVKTKKKIIDLENVAVSGDDAKDATLLWSNDSQRVAYFNESRAEIAARIYFRNGDTFEEVPLPEIPRCDEIKVEDPKYLSTVSYRLTPKHWIDTQTLFVEVYGEWKTLKGEYIGCGQNALLAFDRQQKASIAKIERP